MELWTPSLNEIKTGLCRISEILKLFRTPLKFADVYLKENIEAFELAALYSP